MPNWRFISDSVRSPQVPKITTMTASPAHCHMDMKGKKRANTKEEAMEEKRVTDIICTKCRRMLRKKIRWFSSGQRYYLCLATCPEHGMMKGKIRMKKSEDGRVFAVKTVKPVDEEGAEAVFLKKEEARIRRAEKSRQKKLHGVE